jgi:hypothetical protein
MMVTVSFGMSLRSRICAELSSAPPQHRTQQHADRMVASEQRDRDAGEAVAADVLGDRRASGRTTPAGRPGRPPHRRASS